MCALITCSTRHVIDLYRSTTNRITVKMHSKAKNKYPDQCSIGNTKKPTAHNAIKTSGILGPSTIHSRIATPQKAISATNPINSRRRVVGEMGFCRATLTMPPAVRMANPKLHAAFCHQPKSRPIPSGPSRAMRGWHAPAQASAPPRPLTGYLCRCRAETQRPLPAASTDPATLPFLQVVRGRGGAILGVAPLGHQPPCGIARAIPQSRAARLPFKV